MEPTLRIVKIIYLLLKISSLNDVIHSMEIKLSDITTYFADGKTTLTNNEVKILNSIFDKCDVDGNDVLENDEVPNFQQVASKELGKAWNVIKSFIDGLAGTEPPQQKSSSAPQVQEVPCQLTPEEQRAFDKALQDAKDIITRNQEKLGLTNLEVEYIQNATTESINIGMARVDNNSLKFNYNCEISKLADSNLMTKFLIHEATHASIRAQNGDTGNSKTEERICETRALNCAVQLLNDNQIDDCLVTPEGMKLSDLKNNPENLNNFVAEWLDDKHNPPGSPPVYSKYPEGSIENMPENLRQYYY